MDTNKTPKSHGKKVGEGSVEVNKTEKVATGGQTVGAGGRPGAQESAAPSQSPKAAADAGTAGRTQKTPVAGQGKKPRAGELTAITGTQPTSNRTAKRAATGGGSILLLALAAFLLLRGCNTNPDGGYIDPASSSVPSSSVSTQAPADTTPTVSANARDKRFVPLGNGQDTVTVMVYMCGTDLESNYGMATSDLQEMANATIGANVNVIVETGGCKRWKNNIVSSTTNQIYKVESGGVRLIKDNVGSKAMVEPATLTEFIQFCTQNYPANRNILIFWDHGGGSISGYGYDELYKNAGSMDLAEISTALKAAGVTFDWIGFDACLMATLETALVCNDYADYLIASEETEPGTGWYYTGWLTALSQNTSVDTVTLAKKLIDDYVATSTAASSGAQVTLSVVDLAEMQGVVPVAFNSFSTSTAQLIANNEYAAISNARAGARQFAQSSRINQIDLVNFADRVGTAEAQALSQALRSCIKYNKTTITNAYGLSIFFPYETTSSVKSAISTYNQVGMDEAYTKAISSFASLASSGQVAASAGSYGAGGGFDIGSLLGAYLGGGSAGASSSAAGSGSPLGALLGAYTGNSGAASAGAGIDMGSMMQLLGAFSGGRSLPAEMDWMDTDLVADSAEYVATHYIDPGDIFVTVRADGTPVLSLTDEQWALIQAVELNVFVDDGEGFIDLGLDNVFEFEGNDLLLTFDNTWMTVNGQVVAFYMDYADDEATVGHIPAMLTQTVEGDMSLAALDDTVFGDFAGPQTVTQLVYLNVVFDDAHPDGVITGARPMYADETNTVAKGDIAIGEGDVLDFLCDYYTYDDTFDAAYKLGRPLTVGADGLEIIYYDLGNANCSVTYRLTDIYGNYYWTPAV